MRKLNGLLQIKSVGRNTIIRKGIISPLLSLSVIKKKKEKKIEWQEK